jgi:hypothetical protein
MRTDVPDGSVAVTAPTAALARFAPESAPVFDIAPAPAPRQGRLASLSRLESLQARRRRQRVAYLRRLAAGTAALRDWLARVRGSVGRRRLSATS